MLECVHRPYLSIGSDDFTLAQLELIDGAPWICPSRLCHEIAPACYRGFIVGLQECAEGFSNRRLFEGQDTSRSELRKLLRPCHGAPAAERRAPPPQLWERRRTRRPSTAGWAQCGRQTAVPRECGRSIRCASRGAAMGYKGNRRRRCAYIRALILGISGTRAYSD